MLPNSNEDEVNLEHILPRNPSDQWNHIDEETQQANCRKVGNLALLSVTDNVDAGNDRFSEKRKIYEQSELGLTSTVAQYDTWGSEEIRERQNELARLAIRIWALGG